MSQPITGAQRCEIVVQSTRVYGRHSWAREIEDQLGKPIDELSRDEAAHLIENLLSMPSLGATAPADDDDLYIELEDE